MPAKKFSHFTDPWPEAYLMLTGQGRILQSNAAAKHILAPDGATLEGRNLSDEVTEPAGEVEHFLKKCRRSRQLVLGSLTLRPGSGKDGETISFRAEGTLLEPAGSGGGSDDAIVLLRLRPKDSADRRFQMLNQRIADLNHEILARREAEAAMRALADQLAEANHRKDAFLATLAHELRNPLSPIRTGVEILRLKKEDPETVEKMADTLERQVKQLTVLVNDLLDVSRSSRGKIDLRPETIQLEEVIENAVDMSRDLLEECNHELVKSLPEAPIELKADPFRLAQVISNLLNNAAKYTLPGGRIELSAEQREKELLISVRDNGSGIPAGELENIFVMFTQLPQKEDRTIAGLGVGLTLVRTLVELHGGTVHATSPGEGRGSTFEVRLPLSS